MNEDKRFSKNFFLFLLFGLLVLAGLILKPLFAVLFTAIFLAYVSYPFFKIISKKLGQTASAWIVILLLLLFIITPTFFIVNNLAKEGYTIFVAVKKTIADASTTEIQDCVIKGDIFCELNNKVVTLLKNPEIKTYVESSITKISVFLIDKTSEILFEFPKWMLYLFIVFFTIFQLLLKGPAWVQELRKSIPLKETHIDHMIKQFSDFSHATIYGNLITSIVQGILGGIVFFALGITAPILAGLSMAFFSFLMIGTPIIWLPAAIGLIMAGSVGKGVTLLLIGTFLISTIDNFIKPALIGDKTKLNPAAVLIGIIGGLYTFGFIGIIAGPLILSLAISFIQVYTKEGI